MKIEKELLEDRQAKLTVEYSKNEFEGFKRKAAKKIARNVKIPGFRPGKAPYSVILNHYGEDVIVQEAIEVLLDDYGSILDQAEVKPSEQGRLESIESYDPLKLVFIVPLEPEIDLGDYREIRKPYEIEEFDVKRVDDFIMDLRRNSATIIPAERAAEEGDLVYFTLSGKFPDAKDDEEATITDKTPQQAVIPTKDDGSENEWPYPGFARKLIGVKAGDEKEIKHTFSKQHKNEDFRGKKAVFTVEVQSVKELELPELDDEFIKSLGRFESQEDLRKSIEENMRTEHQLSYDGDYFDDLIDEIVEKAEINYPPQMLAHEEKDMLENLKSRLENQKLTFETYLKLRDMDEETFMESEIRPAAKQRLERSLVSDALVNAEGIELDHEMFRKQANALMTEMIYSGDADEMEKQMGQEEFSWMVNMEAIQRTIDIQLNDRLKLIATGQPIPEKDEDEEADEENEAVEGSTEETIEAVDSEISIEEETEEPDQETEEGSDEPEAEVAEE